MTIWEVVDDLQCSIVVGHRRSWGRRRGGLEEQLPAGGVSDVQMSRHQEGQ